MPSLSARKFHLVDVHLGAGGRLHDDRVGEDGRQEHAGDGIGQLDAGLAELKRDDGGRGADGEVQKENGVGRGNIGDAVVVDDLDDIGVLDTRGRLADLVVIHEDDLLLDFLAIALDRVHVFDEHRLGDVVLLQNPGAFHRSGPRRRARTRRRRPRRRGGQRILQMRVAHGCGDGVVVGLRWPTTRILEDMKVPLSHQLTVLRQYSASAPVRRWAMIGFFDEMKP